MNNKRFYNFILVIYEDDKDFKHLPLIIFSSLITEEMRRKGRDLGADEQLTKPEIGHLVDVMDHLLLRQDKQVRV